ncbi:MAG: hypothetical protein ABIN74_00125, partial [Ferruginibacter sp.]
KLKNDEKGNSWLLIKHRDDYAVDKLYDSEKDTEKNSPINKWLLENKKNGTAKKSERSSLPKGPEAPVKKKPRS